MKPSTPLPPSPPATETGSKADKLVRAGEPLSMDLPDNNSPSIRHVFSGLEDAMLRVGGLDGKEGEDGSSPERHVYSLNGVDKPAPRSPPFEQFASTSGPQQLDNSFDNTSPSSNSNSNSNSNNSSHSEHSTHLHDMAERMEAVYDAAFDRRFIAWTARHTSVQEGAVLSFSLLFLFFLLSVLFYTRWTDGQQVSVVDATYFIMYTITTVGYGDYAPVTPSSRIITVVIILVGIAVSTITAAEIYQFLAIEAVRTQFSRDNNRTLRRAAKLAGVDVEGGVDQGDAEAGDIQGDPLKDPSNRKGRLASFKRRMHPLKKLGFGFVVEVFLTHYRKFKDWKSHTRIGQVFNFLFPLLCLTAVGGGIVGKAEGWSAVDSIYFGVVTITTVGYGDLQPTTTFGKWFTVFFLPFSLVFLSSFLTNIAKTYVQFHIKNIRRLERKLWMQLDADKKFEESAHGGSKGASAANSTVLATTLPVSMTTTPPSITTKPAPTAEVQDLTATKNGTKMDNTFKKNVRANAKTWSSAKMSATPPLSPRELRSSKKYKSIAQRSLFSNVDRSYNSYDPSAGNIDFDEVNFFCLFCSIRIKKVLTKNAP